ncbi:hypothetical protein A0O30_01720 [Pseudomonas sp. LLC-1]|nr:hypothetical protein A0O30_01720 [Pseudomonas sp. LLC-1]
MARGGFYTYRQCQSQVRWLRLQPFDDAGFMGDPVAMGVAFTPVFKVKEFKLAFGYRSRLTGAVIGNFETLPCMQIKFVVVQVVLAELKRPAFTEAAIDVVQWAEAQAQWQVRANQGITRKLRQFDTERVLPCTLINAALHKAHEIECVGMNE